MNKIAILMILMSVAISYAQKLNLKIWGGYATVSMSEVNEELDFRTESFEDLLQEEASVSKVKDGMVVGGDLLYKIADKISIGPRIAYLSVNQGKISISREFLLGFYGKLELTFDASLMPIMFGGIYSTNIGENLSISGETFVGFGLANAKSAFKLESNIPGVGSNYFEVPVEGSDIVIDIATTIEYKIAKNVSFGTKFGYRIAYIAEMKAAKDVPELDIKKGDWMKDHEGNPLSFDYSGFTVGFGVNFRF